MILSFFVWCCPLNQNCSNGESRREFSSFVREQKTSVATWATNRAPSLQHVLQFSPNKHHSPSLLSFTKNHTQLCALVFFKRLPKAQSDLRAWKWFPNNACTRGGSEVQMPEFIWSCVRTAENPAVPSPYPELVFAPGSAVLFQTIKRTGPESL